VKLGPIETSVPSAYPSGRITAASLYSSGAPCDSSIAKAFVTSKTLLSITFSYV
jgi:hypothetical protein